MNGQPVHGMLHPEAGHLCLKRLEGDSFPGVDATFGGASVEGLCSTPALAGRKARASALTHGGGGRWLGREGDGGRGEGKVVVDKGGEGGGARMGQVCCF